jgi:iron complex outermembrane receptor protein
MANTTYLPNAELDPEITWSWELGVEQRIFSDRTVMNLTYFENYTSDYIDSRTWTDSNSVTYAQRDNFGKTEIRGVEFELQQKLTDYLKGFLNYTYIDAEITENKEYPKFEGNRPRYVPENMFNAGMDFRLSSFSASLNSHYVSRVQRRNENDTENWKVYGAMDKVNFVTDMKLGVDFLKNYNASVSVNNIFDEDYYQYAKAPGRTVFGMLTTKF